MCLPAPRGAAAPGPPSVALPWSCPRLRPGRGVWAQGPLAATPCVQASSLSGLHAQWPTAPSLKPGGCLGPHTLPPHPCSPPAPSPGPACLQNPNPGYPPAACSGSTHHVTGFSAQLSLLTEGHLLSDNAMPSAVRSAQGVPAGAWPPSPAGSLVCCWGSVPPPQVAAPWVHGSGSPCLSLFPHSLITGQCAC